MDLTKKRVLVTGGAGFIGSHLVDKLIEMGCRVSVYDNFSTGKMEFLEKHKELDGFEVIKADILDFDALKNAVNGKDFVFHLAANADVRGGVNNTRIDLDQNTIGTWNVLEAMRLNGVKNIMFTSSAAVYGEPDKFPTPEDYVPMQTSFYGAAKLAGEALVQAYCEAFDFKSWSYRFVSVLGPRYSHGVVFDFVKQLLKNQETLKILGDGNQRKSFLHVSDCVNSIMFGVKNGKEKSNLFNIGTEEDVVVRKIADIVTGVLKLKNVEYSFKGGEKGWVGDAPFVLLSIDKIKALGWKPSVTIEESLRETVQYLLKNRQLLERE